MLGVARQRVRREGWRNVHLVRADAARPPVRDADAVLGTFVVGLFEDPGAVVERWVDAVALGGRVAVLEAGRSSRPVARRLNRAFDAFVAAGNPTSDDAPSLTLDARIEAARDALAARADLVVDDRHAAGFVRRFAGARRP
ncbi:class I SAM-dependent methyltransferase [Halobacterium sp. CBA1126]|nr:class I SAM-dependent methyltransferase [Halobacterium sp. CBA1126]